MSVDVERVRRICKELHDLGVSDAALELVLREAEGSLGQKYLEAMTKPHTLTPEDEVKIAKLLSAEELEAEGAVVLPDKPHGP